MLYSKIEGKGKPFLILHGFLGMSDNWKTLGAQFATLGYQVHMLDMRNHGRSFQTPEFDYKLMSNDVLQYCQLNNLEEITLLGQIPINFDDWCSERRILWDKSSLFATSKESDTTK
mgnify:CR=1 FL=1